MQTNSHSPRFGFRTLALVATVALLGTLLSLFIRSRIALNETETARLMAEALKTNTAQELVLFKEVLESVRALHALSDAVDQEAMSEFIDKGMIHQENILGGFGLVQRIGPQLRTVMEAEARSELGSGYIVQYVDENGNWTPAPQKPLYYPLTWQNHENALRIPVGYDFSSDGANIDAIKQIERSGETTLVRSPVFFSAPNQPAHWVFAPVIPAEFQNLPFVAPGSVIGFAVSMLEPNKILEQVRLSSALPQGLKLSLRVAKKETETSTRYNSGSWIYQSTLPALGTIWTLECHIPGNAIGRRADIALAFGLLVTALLSTKLLLLGNRARAIEAEVQVRTNELEVANEQLEKNIQIRARLEEEMNELTASEQRRIGRDLHDSLGQKLTGAMFLSRSLLNQFDNDTEQHNHASTLNETLKSTVTQVRNMARGLASVTLNNERLDESLEQLSEEMSALYNIDCVFSQSGDPSNLSRQTKEQLYFIAREATNNAARHANASAIQIHLAASEAGWALHVSDNGTGMDSSAPDGAGMGLRIMRHRAERIGAEIRIDSKPDIGTTIEIKSKA